MPNIPSDLDNYLLAISRAQLSPQQNFAIKQDRDTISKHMKLYASVALLLVRVRKDNFAVSRLTKVKDGIITRYFYYARNQPAIVKDIEDGSIQDIQSSCPTSECS